MPLSIPYRDTPLPPVFGESTSRSNYCEEDFIITGWVGEFINTLTNIAYLLFALQGLRRSQQDNASSSSRWLYYGLATVGICSAFFHGLLKQYAQMADDTSMQVATLAVLHRAMTFDKSEAYTRYAGALVVAGLGIETAYHSTLDDQLVHELFFLALIVTVVVKTRSLIQERVANSEDRSMLSRLTVFGVGCFLLGYLLWQLDGIYCAQLTAWKRTVGMPWSFIFEFHGWWHVLTAVGAYVSMVMMECLTKREVKFDGVFFAWMRGKRPAR